MSFFEKLTADAAYIAKFEYSQLELQMPAKQLCWQFNQVKPNDKATREEVLTKLLGRYNTKVFIKPVFHCDYGFNIHFHGAAIVNYNCVILDTSPVNIGEGVCIAPGVCISCAGHAIDPQQRIDGLMTSAPITLEDEVWLGANTTVCAGVTIGKGSIIGAGSVVTKDIPPGVVAVGNPCKVLRLITVQDRIKTDYPI